jgi:hypothetical protein
MSGLVNEPYFVATRRKLDSSAKCEEAGADYIVRNPLRKRNLNELPLVQLSSDHPVKKTFSRPYVGDANFERLTMNA